MPFSVNEKSLSPKSISYFILVTKIWKKIKNHGHIFLTTAMDIRSKKEHVFLKRKKGSKERKKESDSNRIRFSVLAYLNISRPRPL